MEPYDYTNLGLPKWPAMIVRGTPVTPEQAKEIIRRTDRSFQRGISGNDHEFNRRLAVRLGLPKSLHPWDARENKSFGSETFRAELEEEEAWKVCWGVIETEYVKNDWIASSYIGGPHGWCSPNGTISYNENVGKYPGIGDIRDDWTKIAEAFPFLELTATLMDREWSEEGENPIVTLRVSKGTVVVGPPEPIPESPTPLPTIGDHVDRLVSSRFARPGYECGIPADWIEEWGAIR